MRLDDLVEGPLHVEHHRVEVTAAWQALDTAAPRRGVLSSSVRPIDCASRRAGSIVSTTTRAALLGGTQRDRGGRRRLADPSGPAAHDDAGALVARQRVQSSCRDGPGSCSPCADSSAAEFVQRGEVDAVGNQGSSYVGRSRTATAAAFVAFPGRPVPRAPWPGGQELVDECAPRRPTLRPAVRSRRRAIEPASSSRGEVAYAEVRTADSGSPRPLRPGSRAFSARPRRRPSPAPASPRAL